MKRKICVMGLAVLLGLSLAACGAPKSEGQQEKSQPESSSQAEPEQKEEKVVQGTVNKLGTFLVLVTEDGEYQIMDYGEGVTVDTIMEGDKVEITYTGELGNEAETPVITAIVKLK